MSTRSGDSRVDAWFRRVFVADVDPDRPISPRSPMVLVQMALIAVLAVFVQFAGAEHPGLIAVLLGAAMALQPVVVSTTHTARQTWQRLFALDLAVSTAIALVAPTVVMNHLLVVVGLTGAAASCHHVRGFLLFTVAALSSVAVTTISAGVPGPEQTVATAAVVGVGLGGWMLRAQLVAEAAQRDREQAVDAAGGIFVTGRVGDTILRCHGDVRSLLGWTDRRDGRINLRTVVHPEDLDDYWIPNDQLTIGAEFVRTARFRTEDGGWKWIRDVTRVVESDGRPLLRGVLFDHTDHVDGLMKATTEATTDALTGLSNRRVLLDVLDRVTPDERSLVLFDLDSFKRVNDTLGHEAGDELLRIVAQRIGARVRSVDVFARLGGDEFALVLGGDLPPDVIQRLVDRILDAVAEPMNVNGVVLDVSASAGIVREADGVRGSKAMLRRADLAMYEAKRQAAGSRVFSPSMDVRHGRKAVLVRDLPDALDRGDLRLFFQPLLDITGRRVVGAEGLARWTHPHFGVLTPGDFLDVVLVSSQAAAFTRAMIVHALEMASRVSTVERPLTIAVNLPMSTLEDSAFARWFFEACDERDVDPSAIVFEMSEQELHSDERTVAAIEVFTTRGVTISIDDFGTGHSTFDRLRWTGVSQLKLDQLMVQGASANQRDATILRNVVAMASELGYETVGEGVETDEQRSMLERFGVDIVQGYLFARPLDREDFVAFAERSPAPHALTAR